MKRMLFNATQAEELRVAIVDGQKLIDLDIESAAKEQKKSNIYKAVITRIEPSLEAAFVDYGAERHGFLPFKEISRSYFQPGVDVGRASIKEALREGQELIVQVDKDERGNKGAALTTFISLAGRYLVLMPNNPRGGGVSRRVEGDERAELREVMDQLEVPHGMSLIARTAAIGRGAEELQWDLNYLLQLWKAIESVANSEKGALLIYLEGSLVIRAIRDYFQPDIGEILIDTDDVYEQARHFMATVMPNNVNRIKRYRDDVPLFSRFQIEHQIESAYSRQVNLPSGGAIVIDHTEALVSVDVNSGRATRGADIEETAFKTNLEAAEEIARQLRLRDLGGLIIIDFIDMESARNQREVETRLREGLKLDRARVQTGKISRFGLMELSRQRLRPALAETSYIPCPRCSGTGHIRSAESAALHILRILEEEAMKDNTAAVHTQVPVDVATFLLNEKRVDVQAIEIRHKVNVRLIPNIHLETPQHSIVRLRHDEISQEDLQLPSYKMVEAPAEEDEKRITANGEAKAPRQQAAIQGITPEQPAPIVAEKTKAEPEQSTGGFFAKVMAWLRGPTEQPQEEVKPEKKARPQGQRDGRRGGRPPRREEDREARDNRDNRDNRTPKESKESREQKGTASAPRDDTQKNREPRRQRNEPRTERKDKEQLAPQQAKTETDLPAAPDAALKATEENQGNNSRRRNRRGNGRRDRAEKNDATAVETSAEALVVSTEITSAIVVATTEPLPSAPVEAIAAPIVVAQPAEDTVAAVVMTETSSTTEEVPQAFTATPVDAAMSSPSSLSNVPSDFGAASVQMEMPLAAVEEPAAPSPIRADETVDASLGIPADVINQETFATTIELAVPPTPPTPPTPPVEDAIDIGKALETSGLVMIETSGEKTQTWQPEEEEPVAKPRRRRPAPVTAADEPLVMVETRQP